VDFDLISQLVDADIVSRKMATNLMLIDFPNPVYSPVREALFDQLVARPFMVDPTERFDDALLAFFQSVAAAPAIQSGVRAAATDFLVRWNLPDQDWQSSICDRIDAYLGAVLGHFASGDVADYFRLLAARYAALSQSDHAPLVESHLLLPKTDPFAGRVMRESGEVELSELVANF